MLGGYDDRGFPLRLNDSQKGNARDDRCVHHARRVKAANTNTALDRFNRGYEYDGLGDNYARFLLEEILPAVERKTTSDGRSIRLSKDANDREIGVVSKDGYIDTLAPLHIVSIRTLKS